MSRVVKTTKTGIFPNKINDNCLSEAIIPTRHIHQVIEMVNKDDVQFSIELLQTALENFDQFDWGR